jgi:hypothetical protein
MRACGLLLLLLLRQRHGAPPHAEGAHCVGLGVVTHIDPQRQVLFVATPAPPELLQVLPWHQYSSAGQQAQAVVAAADD